VQTVRSGEVIVLGGGPAGAATSRLLASWGHRVRLITKPPGDQRLAVSLPPSCAKLFDAIGLAEAIDRAGFIRSTGNTVWWGGDARVEPFADGARGWQVDLKVLETVLQREAERAGVTIEHRVVTADEQLSASYRLDCTGRAGLIARANSVRRYDAGPKTIALAGEWRRDSWQLPDDTHTLIESYADGWMWSVPTAGGVRHVSAMIDPQRSDLARGGSARDVYLAEIAKTRAFKNIVTGASLTAGPTGWDASTYGAQQYAGDDWLLVGDAASFIDPLSSAGVKKALASAWLAAVAVNTAIETPSMRAHAFGFFAAREHEIERHYAAESRAFLAAAAREHDRPFWATRSADFGGTSDDADGVRQAFARLKTSDAFRVKVADQVRIEPRALVDGNQIRLAPHVIAPDSAATRYLHGIDLVALLELAPQLSQVGDLFEAYRDGRPPVPLHDFLLALSSVVARGWLVAQ
jgi:flavin-dependent dehydrogenase